MKRFIWKNNRYNGTVTALLLAVSVFADEIITVIYYSLSFSFIALFCDAVAMLAVFLLLNLIPDGIAKKIIMLVFFLFFYGCTLVETVYVGFYGNFAPIRSLLYAGKYVKGELGMRLNPAAYISIACGGAVLIFAALIPLKRAEKSERRKGLIRKTAGFLAVFCAAATVYGGVYSDARQTFADNASFIASGSFAFNTMYNSRAYVSQYGYWSYRLRELTFRPEVPGKAAIDAYFAGRAGGQKAVNGMTLNRDGSGAENGYYNGYNIVNILSESLDTRIIDEVITPNLYRLVYGDGGAYTYKDYYVPVFFDGSTINSEFMSINGIYPVSETMWSTNMGDMYSRNRYDKYSLPAQLGKAGYDTYYFHNEIKKNYERASFMPGFGFQNLYFYDEMSGLPQYENDPAYEWPLDSELARFIDMYAFTGDKAEEYKNGKNFYMNVMTYSMHAGRKDIFVKYEAAVRERCKDKKVPEIVIYYLARAMEYDKLVGDIIDLLKDRGLLENTLLNIYPDHCVYTIKELYTDFLEPRIDPFNDYTVYKQTLIMLDGARYGSAEPGKGAPHGGAANYVTGCTLDLAPTFLNMLLGTGAEYGCFFGSDMMDGSYVVFPDLSVYDGKGYLKINGKTSGSPNVIKLRQLQADAYEKFTVSQGIHANDYFR